jgi:pseudouridine-5'-phosphate glycosidase
MIGNPSAYLELSPEVREAVGEGRPVVALESTIISHGMPRPRNMAVARRLEEIVRAAGAVPATIAIIEGKARIGVSQEMLDLLGTSTDIAKVSRKDIPLVIAQKKNGATTVSATMFLAHLAGIRVFVTGGIGGVHRDGQRTFDISADLTELARTPVAVVCAGAKSILDLGLTLEYLETAGVPVLGWRTDEFPSFHSRRSGLPVDQRIENEEEAAAVMKTKWDLGLEGGLIVAVPVPPEREIPFEEMSLHIDRATAAAKGAGIRGKALTPYLLEELLVLTGGRSLETNIALVENNAIVGGRIAAAFAKLMARCG